MAISMINLQVASIIILIFIIVMYMKAGNDKKSGHIFLVMNLVSMGQILFDIITVYTINHMETVPYWMNRMVHALHYCLTIWVCFLVYQYLVCMIGEEIGEQIRRNWFLIVWAIAACVGVMILPIQFKESKLGNYATGPVLYVLYATVAEFLLFLIVNLVIYRKRIFSKKSYVVWMMVASEILVVSYHAMVPTSDLSSLALVLVNLGIFLTVENPDTRLVDLLEKETARADAANEAKSMFLANMSHEIRTPINAVLGMNELILRESHEAQIRNYANDIQASARSLLSIINDVLDISKIETGKLTVTPAEYIFNDMIRDVVNMITTRTKVNGLDFEVEIDERIPQQLCGDDVRLRQVLLNLLNNAVKYTDCGTVTLVVRLEKETEEYVSLFVKVKDTGIGIKEEDIPHLFQPFERFDSERNRNIEGTGLGLSITSQILERMGSTLEVFSEYGKGTEFFFSLRQELPDIKSQGASASGKGCDHYQVVYEAPEAEILIVDDNEMNRKVFIGLLKKTKIVIDEAASGEECLEKVAKKQYDIIFMDHMMPGLDGVETMRQMKEMGEYPNEFTPVIMLTANAVVGAKEEYFDEGFNSFLAKPIIPEQLERVVFTFLDAEKTVLKSLDTPKMERVTEVQEQKELPLIDGIDWDYAAMHFQGQEEILQMITHFFGVMDADIKELEGYHRDVREDNIRKAFQTKVHSMKNSAATLGMMTLSGLANVLEDAAKDGDVNTIDCIYPIFFQRWKNYRELLEALVQDKSLRVSATTHMGEVTAILEAIKIAAEEMDIDELDRLLEQLNGYEFEGEWLEKINKIESAIQNFDVEYLMA